MAAIKADSSTQGASLADGKGGRFRFSSTPFLSTTALNFGHHSAARGVYVRIHSGGWKDEGERGVVSEGVLYEGVEWRRYKVDPLLFACRSGFFQAMFNADWKENQLIDDPPLLDLSPSGSPPPPPYEADVVLEALNAEEFEHLLQFLYSDEMTMGTGEGRGEGEGSALHRSFRHLAIDSPWTLRLMKMSAAFTHLVSLLSFAVMYQIPWGRVAATPHGTAHHSRDGVCHLATGAKPLLLTLVISKHRQRSGRPGRGHVRGVDAFQ